MVNDVIEVWINVFIPSSFENLIVPITGGPFAGKTVIQWSPLGVSPDCFLTDDRGFSDNHNASSRAQAKMLFQITDSGADMQTFNSCGTTYKIDCTTGALLGSDTASSDRIIEQYLSMTPVLIHVGIIAAASNPLITGSPDIDFMATIIIRPDDNTLQFDGLIDAFPSFEAYVKRGTSSPVQIFAINPDPGTTPWGLVGGPNRIISKTVNMT